MLSETRGLNTPSRPLSKAQFDSLRERIQRDSPRLYRDKHLSAARSGSLTTPGTPIAHNIVSKGTITDPATELRSRSLFDGLESFRSPLQNIIAAEPNEELQIYPVKMNTDSLPLNAATNGAALGQNSHDTNICYGVAQFGSYENPVLRQLASRNINKELEIQTIVTNVVAILLWNLITKFALLVFTDTSHGASLVALIHYKLQRSDFICKIMKHPLYYLLNDNVNYSRCNIFIHLLMAYNIVSATCRLLSKMKTSDLNLTPRQRQLLGLDHVQIKTTGAPQKPKMLFQDSGSLIQDHHIRTTAGGAQQHSNGLPTNKPSTPYLFKSLETPLKARQKATENSLLKRPRQTGPNIFNTDTQATKLNKTYLKNDLPSQNLIENASNTGYIPSNKYAYKMGTPSIRRRI